jgi:SpoU rRNA methylase family enzyme
VAQSALRESCTFLVVEMGYRVLVANDADEAIELLDDHPEITLLRCRGR